MTYWTQTQTQTFVVVHLRLRSPIYFWTTAWLNWSGRKVAWCIVIHIDLSFNSERIMLITCYFTLINISIWPIDKDQVQTKQSWGSPCIFDAQNSCTQWVSAWLTLLYKELINPNKRIVLNNFAQINAIGLKVIALYRTQGNDIHVLCWNVSLKGNCSDAVYFEKEKEKGKVKLQLDCITRKPVGFMQSCCFVFVGILSTKK